MHLPRANKRAREHDEDAVVGRLLRVDEEDLGHPAAQPHRTDLLVDRSRACVWLERARVWLGSARVWLESDCV